MPATAPSVKLRKRAKQAAGAGTVLLALFSFVVFCGPLGPFSSPSPALQALPVDPSGQISTAATALVPSQAGGGHQSLGGGRVLMSLEEQNATAALPVSNATQLVLVTNMSDSEHHPTQAASLSEGSGDNSALLNTAKGTGMRAVQGDSTALLEVTAAEAMAEAGRDKGQGWWSRLLEAAHVEPSKSIVLRPSNREVESQALQGLKANSASLLFFCPSPCSKASLSGQVVDQG